MASSTCNISLRKSDRLSKCNHSECGDHFKLPCTSCRDKHVCKKLPNDAVLSSYKDKDKEDDFNSADSKKISHDGAEGRGYDHDDFHSQQPVKGAEDFVRDENREHNCSSSERPALVHDQINMHQDVEVAEYFVSYENREHNCGCFERPAFEHHEIQRQQHPQITQNDFHPDLLRTSYVLTGSTPLNPEISYSLSSEYQSAIYRNRLSRVVFYFYIDDECGLILEFFLFDYYY